MKPKYNARNRATPSRLVAVLFLPLAMMPAISMARIEAMARGRRGAIRKTRTHMSQYGSPAPDMKPYTPIMGPRISNSVRYSFTSTTVNLPMSTVTGFIGMAISWEVPLA